MFNLKTQFEEIWCSLSSWLVGLLTRGNNSLPARFALCVFDDLFGTEYLSMTALGRLKKLTWFHVKSREFLNFPCTVPFCLQLWLTIFLRIWVVGRVSGAFVLFLIQDLLQSVMSKLLVVWHSNCTVSSPSQHYAVVWLFRRLVISDPS